MSEPLFRLQWCIFSLHVGDYPGTGVMHLIPNRFHFIVDQYNIIIEASETSVNQ
jgi:hypothetical protein